MSDGMKNEGSRDGSRGTVPLESSFGTFRGNRPKEPSPGSHLVHPIPPTFDKTSRILVLGSFPSPKSRESGYFYGHPQNRFWRIIADLFDEEVPVTVEEKHTLLQKHHIAAWDVIQSCTIKGASDSSISDVIVNDLRPILEGSEIRQIFVNGKTAYKYFRKYTEPLIGRTAVCLPSTSPANAAWSLSRLIEAWGVIKEYTE